MVGMEKHKTLEDFKAELLKLTGQLGIAKIRLLSLCEESYPGIDSKQVIIAARDYKSLFHERNRLIASEYLRKVV